MAPEIVPVVISVKLTPLLATPETVTTAGPVPAPAGTGAAILVFVQFVGVAATPLNVSVLVPCVAPKLEPVTVTDTPVGPDVGEMLLIEGGSLSATLRVVVRPCVTAFPVLTAGTNPVAETRRS